MKLSNFRRSLPLCTLLVAAAASVSPAFAAITSTGNVSPANPALWTTQTTATVGGNATGAITVDGGSLLSAKIAYLGNLPGVTGTATIDGTGSSWTLATAVYVGNFGNGILALTNGGSISVNGTTYVGQIAGSSGTIDFGGAGGTLTTLALWASPSQFIGTGTINTNSLVTDGTLTFDATHGLSQSLLWNSTAQQVTVALNITPGNGELGVGYLGNGSMMIQDGLAVRSATGYLGYRAGAAGSATIDGSGSSWTLSQNLYAGYSGSGTLTVTNGGQLAINGTAPAYLGFNAGSSGALLVNGLGSIASIQKDLYVGNSGQGVLAITNAGVVAVGGTTRLAFNNGSSGALAFGPAGGTLTTASLWASPSQVSGTGTIVTSGLVTDGALVFDATHGSNQTFLWNSPSQNVAVTLNLASTGDLGVGYLGSGSLTISDGAAITTLRGYLGYRPGSNGTAAISGTASSWTPTVLYVGYSGNGSLSLASGGKLNPSPSGAYLGFNASSSGTATIDGIGSTWTSSFNLYIGNSGTGSIAVTNGGKLTGGTPYLGYNAGATGILTINGAGSALSMVNGQFYVGYSGTGSLTLSNGGTAVSRWGYLGQNAGSVGTMTIDGPGSSWTISGGLGDVIIGNSGKGTLILSNGGSVTVGNSASNSIGRNAGSVGKLIVDGTGSTFATSSTLYMGYSGSGSLSIVSGGTVTSYNNYLGYNTGSSGAASIDGPRSLWSIVDDLNLGYSGTGSLSISNGGTVTITDSASLGVNSGSTGSAFINGTSSTWAIRLDLYVGNSGSGTLAITNGATVSVGGKTFVAYNPGSQGAVNFGPAGGTLTTASLRALPSQVTGTGTINTGGLFVDGSLVFDATHGLSQTFLWNSPGQNVTVNLNVTPGTGDLGVGYSGSGTLTLKDGLAIRFAQGYFGYNAGASGNATIAGAGSSLTLTNAYVGYSGTGNLAITSGARLITNFESYIGQNAGSVGAVTVDGANWTSQFYDTYVGNAGNGSLVIINGGKVNSGNGRGIVGVAAGSTGLVTVDGPGSAWNLAGVWLGSYGNGTLAITNGGTASQGSSYTSFLGEKAGSNGTLIIDGPGSAFTINVLVNYLSLICGQFGTGTISISNGGKATTSSILIGTPASLVSITAGDNSLLTLGGGTLSNSGTVRVKAAPGAVPGNPYSPILAAVWAGAGAVQPLGGTWNTANHTFTPSAVADGTPSQSLSIDRSQFQRLRITNADTTFLASLLPSVTSSTFSLTASPLTESQSALLKTALGGTGSIFAAWSLASTGYTASDPSYLSLSLPSGFSTRTLSLWRFDGAAWSRFSPVDFTYDGTYASFTTTDLLGYAISGPIPLLGDATLDGKVDAFDLNLLAAHWQQPAGSLWQNGDFTGDGKVDAFDLNLLASNWQSATSLQSALAAIPEPTTLSLLVVAGTLLLLQRKRSTSQR